MQRPPHPPPVVATNFSGFGSLYKGKVRDVYRPGNGQLILITTDRISAFDHVLAQAIPLKGQVLNQLAGYFFDRTKDLAPNHIISIPDPNVTIALECVALPIEFVVRGYLAGHAARIYAKGGRSLCGATLPDGLVESSRLPTPILTPATKADEGHDEDISPADIIRRGILTPDLLEEATAMAFRLFERGTQIAAERGLLLVDTKYEFGMAPDGQLVVIDEVHTPDSSRYYYAEGYEKRLGDRAPQRQLSKEFVREWLMARGFQGLAGQVMPDLTPEFVHQVSSRYIELYETVTGEQFVPDLSPDPARRIEQVLATYFQ